MTSFPLSSVISVPLCFIKKSSLGSGLGHVLVGNTKRTNARTSIPRTKSRISLQIRQLGHVRHRPRRQECIQSNQYSSGTSKQEEWTHSATEELVKLSRFIRFHDEDLLRFLAMVSINDVECKTASPCGLAAKKRSVTKSG
jgi:hypothetical protein